MKSLFSLPIVCRGVTPTIQNITATVAPDQTYTLELLDAANNPTPVAKYGDTITVRVYMSGFDHGKADTTFNVDNLHLFIIFIYSLYLLFARLFHLYESGQHSSIYSLQDYFMYTKVASILLYYIKVKMGYGQYRYQHWF